MRVRPHKMSGRWLSCFRVGQVWVAARSDAHCACSRAGLDRMEIEAGAGAPASDADDSGGADSDADDSGGAGSGSSASLVPEPLEGAGISGRRDTQSRNAHT